MNNPSKLLILLNIVLLSACVSNSVAWKNDTNKRIQEEISMTSSAKSLKQSGVPSKISKALIPRLRFNLPSSVRSPIEQKFNVSVNKIKASDMYMNLVKETPISVVIDPSVKGKVTLSLKKVTLDDVFNYMQDVYGYHYEKRGMQYYVYGNILRSKIFHVDYISMIREGVSNSDISSGGLDSSSGNSGVKIQSKNSVRFWENLSESLTLLIGTGDGKKVVVNRHSGYIIVHAWPNEIRVVEDFLSGIQSSITRQVVLETKLLEIELKDGFEMGVNWGSLLGGSSNSFSASQTGGGGGLIGSGVDVINNPMGSIGASAFGGVFGVALQTSKFSAFVEAISTQGDVHVLSSPRIAAINNQKAVIKVGGEEFFVTGITQGTESQQADGTTTDSAVSVEIESFFSGIALDVTPQIDSDGNIILHLHPTVSDVSQKNKSFIVGGKGFDLPLAASSVRETDTVVRAKSGQIIVVGGLMKESTIDEESSVPFLGDLPFIGYLFKHKKIVRVKKELVVLMKPTLVNTNGQWSKQTNKNAKRFAGMER